MGDPQEAAPAQFIPRARTDVYPFIYPEKFKGSLHDKVTIITGPLSHTPSHTSL